MHFDVLLSFVFCCVMCKMRKEDVLGVTPFFALFRIVMSRKNLYTGRVVTTICNET